MKKIFLLILVPVLLVTLGFGQTAVPSSNADQASLKGCLAGSDGNYTVAEDGTTQLFKITSSTVDLKPHLGHDVEIIGQKANAAANSGSSDKSVIVTGVNMISEHCATATASAPAVADPAPTATASTPAVADPPTATPSATMTASATAPENTERMPDTASPLPLLGLLGFGLLTAGLLSRRLWTNQR
jgi:hypothetical protein